jgi:NitT/TauT family transport system permease protein
MKLPAWISPLLPLVVFAAFIGLWELVIWLGHYPAYLLPGPWEVVSVVPGRFGDLTSSFLITLKEAAAGFFLSAALGLAVALVFAVSPVVRKLLYPYVVVLQTLPILAISPLIILWLGNGEFAVFFIALLIGIPAVIANTTQGLISVEQNLIDLFEMSNVSTATLLFKLRLPHALPQYFTGLRIAAGASVVGAIVGETYAGSSSVGQGGLGYASFYAAFQTQTTYLFALVLVSSLMGILFFFGVSTLEWFFLRNWHSSVLTEKSP